MMKNASIKQMISKQKLDANDRKDLVSGLRFGGADLGFVLFVGNTRQEKYAAEPADQ